MFKLEVQDGSVTAVNVHERFFVNDWVFFKRHQKTYCSRKRLCAYKFLMMLLNWSAFRHKGFSESDKYKEFN